MTATVRAYRATRRPGPGGFAGHGAKRWAGSAVRLATVGFIALCLWTAAARARPPEDHLAVLRHGINITGWFRYPASRDPAALRAFIGQTALADLKAAGFSFIRLAADPAILEDPAIRALFVDQIRRIQGLGLAVVVSPHPVSWHLDQNQSERDRFEAFWRGLAPLLRPLPPALTIPEVLNEPVFREDPAAWHRWQHDLLGTIRRALPANTIVLTGHDWGSIAGLLALTPEADSNVVYSFHDYDPPELTSLAAYRPGLDKAALARLPFPETDAAACERAAGATDSATRDLIRFYCATGWDAARVRARLQDAATWARANNVVLLAGEFGIDVRVNSASRLAWLRLVRETCEAHGIGWALWGYDDIMGLAVRRPLPVRPVLDRSVLSALGLTMH